MSTYSNDPCNVKCCVKKEKFTKYQGWRDPELGPKAKLRSIPNRMKRFLADMRGELIVKDTHREIRRATGESKLSAYSATPSRSTTSRHSRTASKPGLHALVDIPGYKTEIEDCHKWNTLSKSVMRGSGTIRCATCDFPYDSSKRRLPPHPYHPIIVPLPLRGVDKEEAKKTSSAEVKNLPSRAWNKVHRLKRRRSSTELYKGLVSVNVD